MIKRYAIVVVTNMHSNTCGRVNVVSEWWYGPVLCKVAPYLQGVAVSASVHTLAAVAIER